MSDNNTSEFSWSDVDFEIPISTLVAMTMTPAEQIINADMIAQWDQAREDRIVARIEGRLEDIPIFARTRDNHYAWFDGILKEQAFARGTGGGGIEGEGTTGYAPGAAGEKGSGWVTGFREWQLSSERTLSLASTGIRAEQRAKHEMASGLLGLLGIESGPPPGEPEDEPFVDAISRYAEEGQLVESHIAGRQFYSESVVDPDSLAHMFTNTLPQIASAIAFGSKGASATAATQVFGAQMGGYERAAFRGEHEFDRFDQILSASLSAALEAVTEKIGVDAISSIARKSAMKGTQRMARRGGLRLAGAKGIQWTTASASMGLVEGIEEGLNQVGQETILPALTYTPWSGWDQGVSNVFDAAKSGALMGVFFSPGFIAVGEGHRQKFHRSLTESGARLLGLSPEHVANRQQALASVAGESREQMNSLPESEREAAMADRVNDADRAMEEHTQRTEEFTSAADAHEQHAPEDQAKGQEYSTKSNELTSALASLDAAIAELNAAEESGDAGRISAAQSRLAGATENAKAAAVELQGTGAIGENPIFQKAVDLLSADLVTDTQARDVVTDRVRGARGRYEHARNTHARETGVPNAEQTAQDLSNATAMLYISGDRALSTRAAQLGAQEAMKDGSSWKPKLAAEILSEKNMTEVNEEDLTEQDRVLLDAISGNLGFEVRFFTGGDQATNALYDINTPHVIYMRSGEGRTKSDAALLAGDAIHEAVHYLQMFDPDGFREISRVLSMEDMMIGLREYLSTYMVDGKLPEDVPAHVRGALSLYNRIQANIDPNTGEIADLGPLSKDEIAGRTFMILEGSAAATNPGGSVLFANWFGKLMAKMGFRGKAAQAALRVMQVTKESVANVKEQGRIFMPGVGLVDPRTGEVLDLSDTDLTPDQIATGNGLLLFDALYDMVSRSEEVRLSQSPHGVDATARIFDVPREVVQAARALEAEAEAPRAETLESRRDYPGGTETLENMSPLERARVRTAAATSARLQLEPWLASDWIKAMQDSEHALTLSIPTLEEATAKDKDGNPVYQVFRIPGTNTGYALKRVTPETDWMESGFDGWEVTGVIASKEDGELMSGLANIIIGHAVSQNTDMPLRLDAFDVRKEGAVEGTGKLPYVYRKNGFVNSGYAAYDVVGFGVPADTLVAQMKAWEEDGWTPEYDYDGPTPELDGTPIPSNLPAVWYGQLDERLVQEERERIRDEGLGRWLDVRGRGDETRPGQRTLGSDLEGDEAGVQRAEDAERVERPVGEAETARRARPRGELRVGERAGRATGDEQQPADGSDLAVERDRVNLVELAAEVEAEVENATPEQLADMLTGMDLLPGNDWFDAYDAWKTAQPEGNKQGPEWESFKAIADAHAQSIGLPNYGQNREALQDILDMRARTVFGLLDKLGRVADKEVVDAVSEALSREMVYAFERGDWDASDWYAENISQMWEALSKRIPELDNTHPDVQENRIAFSLMLAALSNGEDVEANMEKAIDAFQEYLRSGESPAEGKTYRKSNAMINAFALREHLGSWVAVEEWLMHSGSIKDIRADLREMQKELDAAGIKANLGNLSGEMGTEGGWRALAIGPKLGAFYMNLRGNYNPLTMDIWFTRTIARMIGVSRQAPVVNERNAVQTLAGLYRHYEMEGDAHIDWMLSEVTNESDRQVIESLRGQHGMFTSEDVAALEDIKTRNSRKATKPLWDISIYKQYQDPDMVGPPVPPLWESNGFHRSMLEGGDDFRMWVDLAVTAYASRDFKEPNPVRKVFVTPANTLRKNIKGSTDTPGSGANRLAMRRVTRAAVKKANAELKRRGHGIELSNASAQALLWYFEKGLYFTTVTGAKYGKPDDQNFAAAVDAVPDTSLESRRIDELDNVVTPDQYASMSLESRAQFTAAGGNTLVNEDGQPREMYHWTRGGPLTELLGDVESPIHFHVGTAKAASDRARHITRDITEYYSVSSAAPLPDQGHTTPLYVRVANPVRVRDLLDGWDGGILEALIDSEEFQDQVSEKQAMRWLHGVMSKQDIPTDERGVPLSPEEHMDLLYDRENDTGENFWVQFADLVFESVDDYQPSAAYKLAMAFGFDAFVYRNQVEDPGQDSYLLIDETIATSAIGGSFDLTTESLESRRLEQHDPSEVTRLPKPVQGLHRIPVGSLFLHGAPHRKAEKILGDLALRPDVESRGIGARYEQGNTVWVADDPALARQFTTKEGEDLPRGNVFYVRTTEPLVLWDMHEPLGNFNDPRYLSVMQSMNSARQHYGPVEPGTTLDGAMDKIAQAWHDVKWTDVQRAAQEAGLQMDGIVYRASGLQTGVGRNQIAFITETPVPVVGTGTLESRRTFNEEDLRTVELPLREGDMLFSPDTAAMYRNREVAVPRVAAVVEEFFTTPNQPLMVSWSKLLRNLQKHRATLQDVDAAFKALTNPVAITTAFDPGDINQPRSGAIAVWTDVMIPRDIGRDLPVVVVIHGDVHSNFVKTAYERSRPQRKRARGRVPDPLPPKPILLRRRETLPDGYPLEFDAAALVLESRRAAEPEATVTETSTLPVNEWQSAGELNDYRVARAMAAELRSRAKRETDKDKAAALRAAARDINRQATILRKRYVELRRATAAQQRAANIGYREGLAVARSELREKIAKVKKRQAKERRRDLRRKQKETKRAATLARKRLRNEMAAIKRAARAAIETLPLRLRGRFLVRALRAKTLDDITSLANDVVRASVEFEAQSTRNDIKNLRKRLRKRGMTNKTRDEITEILDMAFGLLTDENNRLIKLESMTDLLERVQRARDLVETALDVYFTERAQWKDEQSERRERIAADRAELAGNLRKKKKPRRPRRVDTTTDDPSLPGRLWDESLDADGLFESMEGNESVLRRYWNKIRAAKSRMWKHKRSIERKVEAALKRAGYASKEDYLARATDMYGEGAAETVTVVLGGTEVTLTLNEALSLAAIDPETLASLPENDAAKAERGDGAGVVFRGTPGRARIAVTQEEILALRDQLGPTRMQLVADLKDILESEVRDQVFEIHFQHTGKQPKKVENYWPRARRRSELDEDVVSVDSLSGTGMEQSSAATEALLAQAPFTKERTGGGTPFLVGGLINVFDQHIDDALALIHLSGPIRDFDSLMMGEGVQDAMSRRMGDTFVRRLRELLAYGVGLTGRRESRGPLALVQSNLAGAHLTLSPLTWVRMFGGSFRLWSEIPTKAMAMGLAAVRAYVPGLRRKMIERIEEASGYFYERHRRSQVGRYSNLIQNPKTRRQLRSAIFAVGRMLKQAGDTSTYNKWQQLVELVRGMGAGVSASLSLMRGIDFALRAIDRQIMLFAVEAHMAEGMTFEQAVHAAEMTFRRTQNTSDPMDDSMISARIKGRDDPTKMLLLYSSDSLKGHNQIRKAARDAAAGDFARAGRTAGAMGVNMVMASGVGYAVSSALVGLSGLLDDDEEEFDRMILNRHNMEREASKAKWRSANDVVGYGFGIMGWFAQSVVQLIRSTGEGWSTEVVDIASVTEINEFTEDVVRNVRKASEGELESGNVVDTLIDLGMLFGIPLAAPSRLLGQIGEAVEPPDTDEVLKILRKMDREDDARAKAGEPRLMTKDERRRLAVLERQRRIDLRNKRRAEATAR